MSLSEVLQVFSRLTVAQLSQTLAKAAVPVGDASAEELLKRVSIEVLAIGVEDLLDRGKAARNGEDERVQLEERVKRDLPGWLESQTGETLRQMGRDLGLEAEEASEEELRVRMMEETVLLGTEGFLDLQESAMLEELERVVGAEAEAGDTKQQQVEKIMVKIFHLKPRQAKKKRARLYVTKTDVAKLKVAELRQYCQENGMAESGLKADLVERVWNNENNNQ